MAYKPTRQLCVYIVAEDGSPDVCKIGITELLSRRLGSLQSQNWRKLSISAAFPIETADLAWEIEQAMLHIFEVKRIRGEWVRVSPTEMEVEIVNYLKAIGVKSENVFSSGKSNVIKMWANQ